MEEIKVGDYIRTIDGYIRKVIQVNKKGTYDALCHGAYNVDIPYKNSLGISAKKIKAHSENIIELIEVGDYVNGYYVEKVWEQVNYRMAIVLKASSLIQNIMFAMTIMEFPSGQQNLMNEVIKCR